MTTETVIRHDDGSVTVERTLMAGVKVGATDPLGSEWHAHRAAYAEEVKLRDRIRQVGITQALEEAHAYEPPDENDYANPMADDFDPRAAQEAGH